jgi:hypothetical protein
MPIWVNPNFNLAHLTTKPTTSKKNYQTKLTRIWFNFNQISLSMNRFWTESRAQYFFYTAIIILVALNRRHSKKIY